MKQVLFVSPTLGVGGAQQHMIILANYLQANNCKVLIINITSNNDLAYRLNKEVELINFPRAYNYDLGPSKKIAQVVKERNIKYIFCDSLFTYLYIQGLYKSVDKISIIFHTTNYTSIYNYFKDLVVRLLLKPKVLFIGISKNQISHLSKSLGIPTKKFELIYNGIDTTTYNFEQRLQLRNSNLRAELDIPQDAFVIIKTARFNPEKNHELAIQVLDIVRKKHQINAYMLFVGGGDPPRMELIKEIVSASAVNDYVKMVGMQTNVRPYLAISDLFTLSSKAVETFSLAALEAMAMGLPAVITDLGGAKEMVFDGKNGYVTPFTDADYFAQKIADVYHHKLEMDNKSISNYIIENFNVNNTNKKLEQYIL